MGRFFFFAGNAIATAGMVAAAFGLRSFTGKTAAAAERWVENAYQANQDLGQLDALNRIKDDFEGAGSLAELEAGAALAEKWAEAADRVGQAIAAAAEPQGLLGEIGLWGVDLQPDLDAAMEAAHTRFATVLQRLVDELPALRREVSNLAPTGPVARRMHRAARRHSARAFVTPMAAVAGAVADEILGAMRGASGMGYMAEMPGLR